MSPSYKKKSKGKELESIGRESSTSSGHQDSKTLTPSSSFEESRSTPPRTKSGGLRGSNRYSTKSSDEKKPWLNSKGSPTDETGRSLQRTSSGTDNNILHAPKVSPTASDRKKLTMPSSPHESDDENDDFLMNGTANEIPGVRSFDDLWDESMSNATSSYPQASRPGKTAAGKVIDKDGFASKSKSKRGSRAPPNTPTEPGYQYTTAARVEESPVRKENPIRHPRMSTAKPTASKPAASADKAMRTSNSHEATSAEDSRPAKMAPPDTTEEDEKPKPVYKDKDEAITSLEKQLDRVTFLQKRQFDQLSSLKKMLLVSRAKEKEHLEAGEELKAKSQAQESEIVSLKEQLSSLQTTTANSVGNAGAAAMVASSAGTAKSSTTNNELQERDARIDELEKLLAEMTKEKETTADQLGNSLAVAESKLRKKADQYENLHEELEEIRERLTTANASIEHLEEERNLSRAKMAELNEMVESKGGLSENETELLNRAAEISSLRAKLSTIDGKVQERDNKIYILEEEMKSVSDLIKQLSDSFVSQDKELESHQSLLLESSGSASQTCSLLLMNMMNQLDTMKTRLTTLQKERDEMNAKASDRGIQLAESHIRVDKLRTELRRMRIDRERARARAGQPLDPTDRRRKGPPPQAGQRPLNASHTGGPNGGPAQSNQQREDSRWSSERGVQQRRNSAGGKKSGNLKTSSERSKVSISTAPPGAAAPPQKPSRFLSFIKGNLGQESEKNNDTRTSAARNVKV